MTPAEYQILKESFERRLIADAKLSHSFLRVGIVIKWYMNQHSGNAWPGVETIKREARVSERTVNRAIKYFQGMGHMEVVRRPGGVNHYFPQPETPDKAMTGVNEEGTDKAMTGGTDKAMTGTTDKAMTPEPSTEPSREPSPYGYDFIVPSEEGFKEEESGRGREEVREEEIALAPSDSPLSLTSESFEFTAPTWKACFRFAREEFPDENGESLVGRFWKRGDSVEWVWNKLCEAKESGEALGRVFWQPGE